MFVIILYPNFLFPKIGVFYCMKIVSLLPSATEIVYLLNLQEHLVGVSHECDFPAGALGKPAVTNSKINKNLSSQEIDLAVKQLLKNGESLYGLDEQMLEEIRPDIILTQELCTVCAVSATTVARVVHNLSFKTEVINLEPHNVEDIFSNIMTVAKICGVEERGRNVVRHLRNRVEYVKTTAERAQYIPTLFCMEWINPPFAAGHWNPEIAEIAGGKDLLSRKNFPSRQVSWNELSDFNPEKIVLMVCGFNIERTAAELEVLQNHSTWSSLRAVKENEVYVADGNSFFARPGPRIVDSLEMLAQVLHPELFDFHFPESSIINITNNFSTTGIRRSHVSTFLLQHCFYFNSFCRSFSSASASAKLCANCSVGIIRRSLLQ